MSSVKRLFCDIFRASSSDCGFEYCELLGSLAIYSCVSLGTCKDIAYVSEVRTIVHALNVDVVNLFHDVKDLNLTNRFVHSRISPIAIAKI